MEHGESAASDRIASLRRIDLLCDEFESACRQGAAPNWDFDTTGFSSIDRSRLIGECLRIEIAHRRRQGTPPSEDEYLARFPQFSAEIRSIFKAGVNSSTQQNSGATDADWQVSEADDLWKARTISSTYRAIRRHAEGGLGLVALAIDQGLQRLVAVKQLRHREQSNARAQIRFIQEAQITARLEHPGIVPVYGLGADEQGRPFYAMRYIDGDTLRQAIEQLHRHPAPWSDAEWLVEVRRLLARFISLCQTIHYAHSAGVIHRDIKPGNVILGKFGETWIVDWGMAKSADDLAADQHADPATPCSAGIDLTQTGSLMGTPSYMSPEQAAGSASANDRVVDIYGLGATLTHLLSGRPPVSGVTTSEIVEKCRRGEILTPRAILRNVPAPLDAVCRKALQFDPRQRYADAAQLARDLELWLAGEPVGAWQEPLWKRAQRSVRRHKTLSGAAVTTLAMAVVMLFVGQQWSARQSQAERLRGLADSVAVADLIVLPKIVRSIQRESDATPSSLRDKLSAVPADSAAARNLRLALSVYGENHVDDLMQDLLRTSPQELLHFREQLRPLAKRIVPVLRQELESSQYAPDVQLRIAGALALYEPRSSLWQEHGEQLALTLCREPANLHGVWSGVFAPIASALTPSLVRVCHDARNPAMAVPAAQLLGLLAHDDAPLLVDLLQQATPGQLPALVQALARHRETCVPLLEAGVRNLEPIKIDLKPTEDGRLPFVLRDRRRARAASALLALERPDLVWPWLESSADATFHSLVVELIPYAGVGHELLYDWWQGESHSARRRILLLMLGTLPPPAVSASHRARWTEALNELERDDPDPGLHSAAQWVLQEWGNNPAPATGQATAGYSPDRRWYETASGETYVIIQGPVEFLMGSPQDEHFRNPADELHLRRIDRSWALASREVTCENAIARVPSLAAEFEHARLTPGVAATRMSWYDAARYCRVLSEEDGVPEDQMCFPPVDQIGPEMELPDDYFERTGYRIPSEAEWEYACRAGTITLGSFGDDLELYDAYVCSFANTTSTAGRPAQKKPNGLGFFDMLGNVQEICFERTEGHPYSGLATWGRTVAEDLPQTRFAPRRTYAVRGGDPTLRTVGMRSGARYRLPAMPRNSTIGFRPVRTLPADWRPFDVVRVLDVTQPGEVHYEIRGDGQPFQIEAADAGIIVEPAQGIAPATIAVRGRSDESRMFQLTLVRTDTQQRRTISGQVTKFAWDVERHDTQENQSGDPNIRATLLNKLAPPLRDGVLALQPASASTRYFNAFEATFEASTPEQTASSDLQPSSFAVLATGRTPLPPGEYYLQVFGDEFPCTTVGSHVLWGPAIGRVVPQSGIDVTLRVSIRTGAEQWRADLFTTSGRAALWVRMQPVPIPP